MIEFLDKKVNVMSSPDGTCYGIFRWKGFKDIQETQSFMEKLKMVAADAGLKFGKWAVQGMGSEISYMRVTFMGLGDLNEAKDFRDELAKETKSYRPKGQGKLS